jgi:hypothetical protein
VPVTHLVAKLYGLLRLSSYKPCSMVVKLYGLQHTSCVLIEQALKKGITHFGAFLVKITLLNDAMRDLGC